MYYLLKTIRIQYSMLLCLLTILCFSINEVKAQPELNRAQQIYNYGKQYLENGYPKESLEYLLQARDIVKRLNYKEEIAAIFNTLGVAYDQLGEDESALSFFKESISIRKQLGLDMELIANYINISSFHVKRINFDRALDYLEEAKQLAMGHNIPDNLGHIWAQIGLINTYTGKYDEAYIALEKARQVFEDFGIQQGLEFVYNTYGLLYEGQGNYDEALSWFLKSLSILQKLNFKLNLGKVYNNIGEVYYFKSMPEKAIEWFNKAITLQEAEGFFYDLPLTYSNMGVAQSGVGAHKEAIRWLEKALRLGVIDFRTLSIIFNNIGDAYHSLENFTQALFYYHKSKGISEALNLKMHYGLACTNIAFCHYDREQIDSALYWAEVSIQSNQDLKEENRTESSRSAFTIRNLGALDIAIKSAYKLNKKQLAFYYAEQQMGQSLADKLVSPTFIELELPKDLQEPYLKTKKELQIVLNQIASPSSTAFLDVLSQRRDSIYGSLEYLRNRIQAEVPNFANIAFPKPIEVKQLQAILKKEEALVSFAINEENVFAFIITQNNHEMIDLGKTGTIIDILTQFLVDYIPNVPARHPVQEKQQKKAFFDASSSLYKLLWLPLLKTGLLKEHIHIVSGGLSNFFPFELLVSDKVQLAYKDYNYLVNTHGFSYHPSATTFYLNQQNISDNLSVQSKRFFGIGLNDFSGNYSFTTRNLNYCVAEVKDISQCFGKNTTTLLDTAATESNLKASDLVTPDYIHFATHGGIDFDNPAFSKLALKPDEKEDGYLHVYELLDLDIQADLISLSACETGRGQLKRGEGTLGFAHSLLYAGTPSLILSIWNVYDPSTRKLFVEYYKNLLKDRGDKYSPLRATQLKMIKAGDKYSNPFYWAPFIFIGAR